MALLDGRAPSSSRWRSTGRAASSTRRSSAVGITGDHTVVALAGATGSGKSSLFNALVGADVATIGARRPTTSLPTAAIWGDADASELLDWLAVDTRHVVEALRRR